MEKDKSWTVPPKGEQPPPIRQKEINRQQLLLRPVEVEKLVEEGYGEYLSLFQPDAKPTEDG